MIAAEDILSATKRAGFDFFTGVPCSFLTALINRVISDPQTEYIGATSEGEAVGIAAGAWLAGRGTVVMLQNSGLGNTINPLTSLNYPFRIPTLLVVTWRGGPGVADEPQHELMGEITPELLDVVRVPHRPFPTEVDGLGSTLALAKRSMTDTGLPFALILEKGTVRDEPLRAVGPVGSDRCEAHDQRRHAQQPTRADALRRLLDTVPDTAALIATTGKCGRELFTLEDRAQHLYQVGSMGCAASMGLGVALNSPRPVVVIDGDGAALMKLGTLATIGAYAPGNLLHIVLDNGVHDSTGGQPTVSRGVDFAAVGKACGYRRVHACDDLDGFGEAVAESLAHAGPSVVHLAIQPGSLSELGRPTVKPHAVAERFRRFLAASPRESSPP